MGKKERAKIAELEREIERLREALAKQGRVHDARDGLESR